MTDNSQFTEEAKLEAWRQLHAGHLERQTKALEQIRGYLFWLLTIVVVGIALAMIGALAATYG